MNYTKVHISRGRFAPSPTGLLHVGNALSALVSWLSVRSKKGDFVYRVEDIDQQRVVAGAALKQMEDLEWFGLDWDEGPRMGGAHGPYEQSKRNRFYEEALQKLRLKDRIFPCRLSRKELAAISSAPHGEEARNAPYPPALRPAVLTEAWLDNVQDANVRFLVEEGGERFDDLVMGPQEENVARSCGDFVLKRKDGFYAYQLAVVVDDIAMGITEVVRGADLISSTARQIQLFKALDAEVPRFGHVPLVLNQAGEKMSKRDGGLTLARLRDANLSPERLVGYLAHQIGLLGEPTPVTPQELVPYFSWGRIRNKPVRLPADFLTLLATH